ncbi:alpha/beta-hydrolase [Westerdykella ornata]|uniref:Alpha/beta-hydrolase n=1 Tax=Westerdykella ornata TaxID=318751 RepID=A0A6A6JEX2_WESOR|nr:alpha/beta-hydrolase [Westerdykella ornata]KAF2273729.1 alpha/beta-hydrolase [Westerdykella ornata]
MSSVFQHLTYFFKLPFHIQWRTVLVQLPRWVPLSILHLTSPKGPQPFVIALPSRKNHSIPIYVFVPPEPVDLGDKELWGPNGEWKVPVVLDFHGGGFIMGSPLEQAPYASMMSRELGAVVLSVSYRIGPFHQFPAAIHDAEDVLSAILDTEAASEAGKVLRTEINRYNRMTEENRKRRRRNRGQRGRSKTKHHHQSDLESGLSTPNSRATILLDPSRLCISGFSAGGNIALNTTLSVPPCADFETNTLPSQHRNATSDSKTALFSPTLPLNRTQTIMDDPNHSWPTVLPPPQSQPRFLPLLLFYPSLDARLLPHQRPKRPLPNSLHPDSRKQEKPKTPGLFSIMSPTYLPKRLRAHPRASPGLVRPEDVQRNATILLVLPEKDSLAVQSDVWVDKMRRAGWDGPVRFGDGREGDWDGRGYGYGYGPGDRPTDPSQSTDEQKPENGGLEVWHGPKCRHGWTQFPTIALGKHERMERDLVFTRALEFVREKWRKVVAVEELGNTSQELRLLKIPTDVDEGVAESSGSRAS